VKGISGKNSAQHKPVSKEEKEETAEDCFLCRKEVEIDQGPNSWFMIRPIGCLEISSEGKEVIVAGDDPSRNQSRRKSTKDAKNE
jgi:hypothetical protein